MHILHTIIGQYAAATIFTFLKRNAIDCIATPRTVESKLRTLLIAQNINRALLHTKT